MWETLFYLAGDLALTELITGLKNKKNKTSADAVVATQAILDEASRRGNDVLDKIVSKINGIQFPYNASDAVNSLISKSLRELNKQKDNVSDMLTRTEQSLSNKSRQQEQLANRSLFETGSKKSKDLFGQSMKIAKDFQNELDKVEEKL